MTNVNVQMRLATALDVPNIHSGLASLAQDLGYTAAFHSTCGSLLKHGFGKTPQFHTAIVEWALAEDAHDAQ